MKQANQPSSQAYAAATNVGRVREHNEDSFLAQAPLFVVADGMGGHEAGEVASEIAVQTIAELAPTTPNEAALVNAVKEANAAIRLAAQEGIGKMGMGCTVTAAMIFGDKLMVAQVGDSRAYLLHDDHLQRITRDHSLVAELVEQGRITEEEALVHPKRSVITRALGSEPDVAVDLYVLQLEKEDRLLLCSDGLSGMAGDVLIERDLKRFKDVDECCEALIQDALDGGGMDNITAIVVDPFNLDESTVVSLNPRTTHSASKAPRKRWVAPVIATVIVIVVLLGAFFGFRAYAKSSYFVIAEEDGYVSIYQGLPGEVLGIKASWLEEKTTISVNDLAPSTANRLKNGISVDSLEEANALIDDYESTIALSKKTTKSSK